MSIFDLIGGVESLVSRSRKEKIKPPKKLYGTDSDGHGDRGHGDGHCDGHRRTLETSIATGSDG